MLHLAGADVQDIFATLPDTGGAIDYKKAVDALNLYFIPKVDTAYARHCFRKLSQAPGETVRQFATRLRRAARDCNYGEETDNQIRDEILCKCTSSYIKRKLFEEGQGLSLDKTLEIAENCEKVNTQMAAMSSTNQEGVEVINYMREKKGNWRDEKSQVSYNKTCYRCGKSGHFAKDVNCPTKGKTFRKCGLKDHFKSQCKTKSKQERRGNHQSQGHHRLRNTANLVNPEEEDPVYAIIIGSTEPERIGESVGGCQLNMIIDSGASVNIVD